MVLRLRQPAPGRTPWEGAKCLGRVKKTGDFEGEFFPEDQKSFAPGVAFCNGTDDKAPCAIRHECLLFALTNNCKIGVWGGTTPGTRKALRKKWPLRRGKEPRPEWKYYSEEDALALINGELSGDDDDDDED
jgi:Transcription factor WhiB